MTLVILLSILAINALDDRYSIRAGEMPENLWPDGSFATPDSYSLRGISGGLLVEQMARSPDRFWFEGDGRIELVDGMYFWNITPSDQTYFGLPLQSQIDAGVITEIPSLASGKEVVFDLQGLPITRFSRSAVGPTTPYLLMAQICTAVSLGGSWSLTDGEFLGKPVQILAVKVERVRSDQPIRPYEDTYWIDKEFLFVLARKSSAEPDGHNQVTEIRFNVPLEESRFALDPPEGFRNCYPISYGNRGEGCR